MSATNKAQEKFNLSLATSGMFLAAFVLAYVCDALFLRSNFYKVGAWFTGLLALATIANIIHTYYLFVHLKDDKEQKLSQPEMKTSEQDFKDSLEMNGRVW